MPTLAVRPITLRDVPRLSQVRQRFNWLDLPDAAEPALPEIASQLLSVVQVDRRRDRIFVASVDGEVCAYVALRPQEYRYRWNVVDLAAGSPRLDATDDVCVELWTALLEHGVRRAGEAGAKRLFATVADEGPAFRSLRAAGFERYSTLFVMRGRLCNIHVPSPTGMREQDDSDVWSVHQLYHHVTPRGVQFAEALTSSAWELPQRSLVERLSSRSSREEAFVLDTPDGIIGHCQVQQRRRDVVVRFLVEHDARNLAAPMVIAAVARTCASSQLPIRVVIPGYMRELIRGFEEAGFGIEAERTALVRHTTAPVVVRTRLAALPTLDAERAAQGVPSYARGMRTVSNNSGGGR